MLRGSEADRKLDIFLTLADGALLEGEHDRSNVLVTWLELDYLLASLLLNASVGRYPPAHPVDLIHFKITNYIHQSSRM